MNIIFVVFLYDLTSFQFTHIIQDYSAATTCLPVAPFTNMV